MSEEATATRRVAGLAGLGTAILFGGGSALWSFEQPDAGAPTGEVVAFYADTSEGIVAGASISLLAIVLFVFFASGVRSILREHEAGDLFATAAFGGALLAVASGLGAETINMVGALRAEDGELTPQLAQALFEISYVLGFNGAGVGLGTFLLAIATVALRANALMSRPLALALVVVGIAFLTPLVQFLLPPAVLALAVVSVYLLRSDGPSSQEGGA